MRSCAVIALMMLAWNIRATETENLGISILPAPGPVVVDGKCDDWDLSGGLFACSDVENERQKMAVWLHAMHDKDHLYLLARWIDETPMNNPGSSKGDYGFSGDCLQFRIITAPDTPQERTSHWTCWIDRDHIDVMDVAYGKKFNEGSLRNAKSKGAQQAFRLDADGKGYAQEIAIPWSLLAKEEVAFQAGGAIRITFEPNFTIGTNGRWSTKDCFKSGVTIDRVFTFMSYPGWGAGTLEAKGKITPHPLRLSDAREFPVHLEKGLPVIDLTGLIKVKELQGFKTITFTMPEDGYISLHLKDAQDTVVRQLLNCAFYTKGTHRVKWDGLTTSNWHTPGTPVSPGTYHWEAIRHAGIGLTLRGWADNAGSAPWDATSTTNWGGDHGTPSSCAADSEQVYLGWSGAEAGKALVACDAKWAVQWKASRGGMSGAELVAVDHGIVYAQNWGGDIFRLEAKTGNYSIWAGSDNSPDLFIKDFWHDGKAPDHADAMDARDGKLYLAFNAANTLLVLDGANGHVVKTITVTAPSDVRAADATTAYVVSGGTDVLQVNLNTGATRPFVHGLTQARALALGKDGKVYVGLREPHNQVLVFTPEGKQVATIGRDGGRALLGKWQADGMAFISGMTIDATGQLWVAESDFTPKRYSVWNAATGQLVKELFGPTTYGAMGGAICPDDPNVMAGVGCEWKLDPASGQSKCTAVITRDGMVVSHFAKGANGKTYLFVANTWFNNASGPFRVYERVREADYRLRTVIEATGDKAARKTTIWADSNGDGQQQAEEISTVAGELRFSGWYMNLSPDMTLYSGNKEFKVAGFTPCGAPQYDLAHPVQMPIAGIGSADGQLVYTNGNYGVNEGWSQCYDIASGKLRWTYPDNFVGVHGSHNACPPETGMIRGSYGACGVVKLPAPLGTAWVIATNVGEWHMLTEDGFYLTRLFEPDPLKVRWPEKAVPGASMDEAPCGMGGEDFGGSATLAQNGHLYLQAGKTGFWNIEVTGLEKVKAMRGERITISEAEVKQAQTIRENALQAVVGVKRLTVQPLTVTFTGNFDKDFPGAEVIRYQKSDDAAVRTAAAWDVNNLYLAWEVKDSTPWVNGATDPAQMYIGGDTVDFQLGVNAKADKNRAEAVNGDLRLSIGNSQGTPTAVLYRKVSAVKKPKTFSSGIVRAYTMDDVEVLAGLPIKVKVNPGRGYLIETAIPLAALGFTPNAGLVLRGDFGVTHGDPAGTRTRLRSYWSNQHNGIVDDAVFELQMEPKYWGEMLFK